MINKNDYSTEKYLAKKYYKKLKKTKGISCPVLKGDKIYFFNRGFKHIIHPSGKKNRNAKQQMKRFQILRSGAIENIIKSENTVLASIKKEVISTKKRKFKVERICLEMCESCNNASDHARVIIERWPDKTLRWYSVIPQGKFKYTPFSSLKIMIQKLKQENVNR